MKSLKIFLSATRSAASFLFCSAALLGIVHASLIVSSDSGKLGTIPMPASLTTPQPKLPDSLRSATKNPASTTAASPTDTHIEISSVARQGWLDSAFTLAQNALESDPNNAFLLLMSGKLSPSGKGASGYFKQIIQTSPSSPEAEESHFRLGQFNYAAGKYYLAIPHFREYLRLFPSGDWKEPAHYWMGNACLSLAQSKNERVAYLDSGTVWFQKLLDLSEPDDYYYPLALEGLARSKAAKGDLESARKAASKALDKAPDEVRGPLLLLAAQLRQGHNRLEEKNLIAQLLAGFPKSPEVRYLRKLNAGTDTARWKSGSAPFRPALAPNKDSLARTPSEPAIKSPTPEKKDLAPKETPLVTPELPGGKGEKKFTLQLGAFSQAANAQAMMLRLSKVGLTGNLLESNRGGKRIFQVHIGKFATAEDAVEYGRTNLKPHRFLSQPVRLAP